MVYKYLYQDKHNRNCEGEIKARDRNDAYRVRDLDSMHVLTPYLMPVRTDNEAFLSEVFDLTKVNEYIAKKNADDPEFKYTFFHFF